MLLPLLRIIVRRAWPVFGVLRYYSLTAIAGFFHNIPDIAALVVHHVYLMCGSAFCKDLDGLEVATFCEERVAKAVH